MAQRAGLERSRLADMHLVLRGKMRSAQHLELQKQQDEARMRIAKEKTKESRGADSESRSRTRSNSIYGATKEV